MNMRSVILSLMAILTLLVSNAQEAAYSRLECELVSDIPGVMPENLVREDFNGDTIACVLVRSDLDDLTFFNNVFEKVQKSRNEAGWTYLVNVIKGSKSLIIRSNRFHEVELKYPHPAKSGEMWYVDVQGIEAPEVKIAENINDQNTRRVRIDAEPFVNLYVDEEFISPYGKADTYGYPYTYTIDLEEGKHYISSKYEDEEYKVNLNLKKDGQTVDARMGGTVIAKNAKDVTITPIDGPEPHYVMGGGAHTYKYDGLLGTYILHGKPSAISISSVNKRFKVDQRSKTVFRLDEMVSYYFIMWHGSNLQPFGFTVGGCKNFGWTFSFNADAKSKIETTYGETHFYETNNSGGDSKTIKSTAWNITTGPMIRLWHKWYLKLEGGVGRYLQPSEPPVM
ncbi:MAG: hypothetical protein K2N25_05670, partial [Muribaculaceae bacterium]|nr:hypothetical protein [Muribaculaceae bacterium]